MAGSGAMEPDPVFRFRLVVAVARALPAVAHVGTGSLPQKVPGRRTGGRRDEMKENTGRVCLVLLLLTNLAPFAGQFEPALTADGVLNRVSCRGREWNVSGASWIPMLLTTNSTAQVILGQAGERSEVRLPVCWKMGEGTVFSAVPAPG